MNDINQTVLVGRLTRDCGSDPNGRDFAYLQNGTCVAKIGIAVNRGRKQADGTWVDEPSFFNVTIFGKTAENLKPYLTKGKQVAIVAHLKQDKWTDQSGQNHSAVSIVADEVQLCSGGGGQQASQQAPQAQSWQQGQQQYQQQKQHQQAVYAQNGMVPSPQQFAPIQPQNDFPEDIPFCSGLARRGV